MQNALRRRLESDREGVCIDPQPLPNFLQSVPLQFQIRNTSGQVRLLKSVYLYDFNPKGFPFVSPSVNSQFTLKCHPVADRPVAIGPGFTYLVSLEFADSHPDPRHVDFYKVCVTFSFGSFQISRYVVRGAGRPFDPNRLRTYRRFQDPAQFPYQPPRHLGTEIRDPPKITLNEWAHPIVMSRPSEDILARPLGQENYVERLRALIYYEESIQVLEMESYDLLNVAPLHYESSTVVGFTVPGLAESRPSLMPGDRVILRSAGSSSGLTMGGTIRSTHNSHVVVVFHGPYNVIAQGGNVDVRFIANRFPFLVRHSALDHVDETYLRRVFLNIEDLPEQVQFTYADLEPIRNFADRVIQLNGEQLMAVAMMLSMQRSRVLPFLLFGPPGTGKTTTLAAAVAMLALGEPRAKVLVAASSNVACDVFTDQLISYFNGDSSRIVRFLAVSRLPTVQHDASVSIRVRNISTAANQSWELVEQAAVVIATLSCLGKFAAADFEFTHIVLDEAGQSDEPESAVALVTRRFSANACIILAGDPQQLGPVVKSNLTLGEGHLDVSLMARLCASYPLYDPSDPNHRPDLVFCLRRSYRAHAGLLEFPSRLFYSGSLVAQLSCDSLLNWDGLGPFALAPILCSHVQGYEDREGSSPSWFNIAESKAVCEYVQQLINDADLFPRVVATDIICLAPYFAQVSKIRSGLRQMGFGDQVRVGTVEKFQGQEARVVIISTVRSSPLELDSDAKYGIGFVANPKRLNVAITRAKELLILVGNLNVLETNPVWKDFIQFVRLKGRIANMVTPQTVIQGPDWESLERLAAERYKGIA